MKTLIQFGWNSSLQQYYNSAIDQSLSVGRVISVHGFKYDIITDRGELETEISGKLLYGTEPEDLPKVGDWVSYMDYETMGYIINVFPRANELSRKNPGNTVEKQVLAANVDFALVIQGLDRDYNLMRLERYLVQIGSCSISPVIILNKADLIDDTEKYRTEIVKLKWDCPVYFCSTITGAGLEVLRQQVLQSGKTYILVGSSGVGKSSLLNALARETLQATSTISDSTQKGKHTTTTRDLFQLPNGSLVIDTPGMREFGLTFPNGQSSEELFPAISRFTKQCHYADCSHVNEPGCGVIAAIEAGELDMQIYESYIKLIKEQRRFEIKIEDKKRLGKQSGKMAREAKNYRKKFKY